MSSTHLAPSDTAPSLDQVLRSRRTIHNFRPEIPPVELVMEAIEHARWAPNHKNTEPWHFYLPGLDTQQAIVDLNARIVAEKKGPDAGEKKRARWSSMPGWLVVTSKLCDNDLRCLEDYAATCCAVHNLSLFLWQHGIGTKWGTGAVTRDHRFFELMQIDPEAHQVVGLFWYGYPEQIPAQQRKPVKEIVTVLK